MQAAVFLLSFHSAIRCQRGYDKTLIFFAFLAAAGILLVFFSSARFLFKSYFSRGSTFFACTKYIENFSTESLSSPAKLPAPEEHSISGSGGTLLKAEYYPGSSPKTAILVPGYADSLSTLYAPAYEYIKRQFNVLIVNPQGVGKSGGKQNALSCVDAKDLLRWLKYLSKKSLGTEFILHGFSFGASAALICISSKKFYKAGLFRSVKAVVADSPYTSLSSVFTDYYSHFTKKSRFQRFYFMRLAHCMSFLSFLSGKKLFSDNSPLKTLKKRGLYVKKFKGTSIPVLFIHGKKDSICNYEMSSILYETAGGKEGGNRIELFDNATHGGSYYSCPEKYAELVFGFLV